MSVAQCRVSHVSKLDVALRTAVHEEIAMRRVELRRGDDLRQLLHVDRLDINDVFGGLSVHIQDEDNAKTH